VGTSAAGEDRAASIDDRDLDGRGMQEEDGNERQREAANAATEERNRLPGLQLQESAMPP
jgi:hypothetical protein